MLNLLAIFLLISAIVFLISFLADATDKYLGVKTWYAKHSARYKAFRFLSKISPLRPWRGLIRLAFTYRYTTLTIIIFLLFHVWLHLANPYASINFFSSPYQTSVSPDGSIRFTQVYKPVVLADPVSDFLGYYRSGFLIAQNTLAGGAPIQHQNADAIIDEIHRRRFDPSKPYLISGDQFSVLYPRNLGVFYNQLLDPNTAHSHKDWENRQRIYLQSVLFAIDGLSVGDVPKTTLVPIAPRTFVTTRVHPGDYGSDAVYGTLFALDKLATPNQSVDGNYRIQTVSAAKQILDERKPQLRHMVDSYIKTVYDSETGLVKSSIHLSSARDGASRRSSFYDNMIFWKTLELANTLGIRSTSADQLSQLKQRIRTTYWSEQKGYYENDIYDDSFSSDWLIGYVTGFFDLNNPEDIKRSQRIVAYVTDHKLADPLPIKYQIGRPQAAPWVIKTFVPNYGGDAIWSYWGAEYMTLLVNLSTATHDSQYRNLAVGYEQTYDAAIIRDGGFPETFNAEGQFLQTGIYKSIRITGWVVQFEHAQYLINASAPATSE